MAISTPLAVGKRCHAGNRILFRSVHRVRGAEAARCFQLVVPDVHGDDLSGAESAGDLDDVGTHAAGTHHGHGVARLHLRLVLDGAVGRHHGAADDAGVGQCYAGGRCKHTGSRHHGVFLQAAHAVHRQLGAVGPLQAALAVVEDALQAIHGEEGGAQFVAAARAVVAEAARHDEAAHHGIAGAQGGYVGGYFFDDAGYLMAQHARHGEIDLALDDVQVRMTDTTGRDAHQHLAGLGLRAGNVFDLQAPAHFRKDGSFHILVFPF